MVRYSSTKSAAAPRLVDLPDLLTVAEYATFMRLSLRTVYRYVAEGKVRTIRVRGSIRIPKIAIEQRVAGGMRPMAGVTHEIEAQMDEIASLQEASKRVATARGKVAQATQEVHKARGAMRLAEHACAIADDDLRHAQRYLDKEIAREAAEIEKRIARNREITRHVRVLHNALN
jgi:excisionase family DNA binding protein